MKDIINLSQLEPQVIIFGGLTLGLLASIWLTFKVVKSYMEQSKHYYNHTNDVIQRNTEAWVENSRINQELIDIIRRYNNPNA